MPLGVRIKLLYPPIRETLILNDSMVSSVSVATRIWVGRLGFNS
jgi:hypothetical protein